MVKVYGTDTGLTTGEAIIYRPPDVGFEAHAILITIPKLVQGPGAAYTLSFTMNTSQSLGLNYEGSLQYTEGSVKGTLVDPYSSPILNALADLTGWLIFTPMGIVTLGIAFTLLSLIIRYLFHWLRRRRALRYYAEMTDAATSSLQKVYAGYRKKVADPRVSTLSNGFPSKSDEVPPLTAPEALLKMESTIINYQKSVKKVQQISMAVGDDTKLTKLHEIFFKAIIDYEIRNYTTNKDLIKYLDGLEQEITTAWETHVEEYKEDVLSNLMIRLNSLYRNRLTADT